MKKSFFLILAFTLGTLPLFSQYYSDDEFVGTWERKQEVMELRSDNSVKYKTSQGNVYYGTWSNVLVWNGNPELRLDLGGSEYAYEILAIKGSQLQLKRVSDGSYFYYDKKYAGGSSLSAGEAGAILLGGLLLYSLFSDSGSDNSGSYDSYDQNLERAKRDKQIEYDIRQSEAERNRNY